MMMAYKISTANIKGNMLEIPEYIISQIPKNSNLTLSFQGIDEQAEDEYLLALAEERLKNGSGITYTMQEVMERHGITQEDLDNAEEDEFE